MKDFYINTIHSFFPVICPDCEKGVHAHDAFFMSYLEEPVFQCSVCGLKSDPIESLYKISWSGLLDDVFARNAFNLIGASSTHFNYVISPEETKKLVLNAYEVPDKSRVLYTNHTVQSEEQPRLAFPVELQKEIRDQESDKNILWLYGRPMNQKDKEGAQSPTKVGCLVVWLDEENISDFYPLYTAITAFRSRSYEEAVIAANSSVEHALYQVVDKGLEGFVSNRFRRNFLTQQCTYSGQLRVLLNLVLENLRLGSVSNELIDSLNNLRKLRNTAAHQGKLPETTSPAEIEKLIVHSIFATHLLGAIFRFLESTVE